MNLEEGPFVFRVNDNGSGPNLLIQVCMERGWREYTDNSPIRDNWNLWWKTSAFTASQHKNLKAWQFTNHIPKGASICRKDNLARNLKCMRKVYGSVYDISPMGYNLPLEYTKLVADCSRNADEETQKVWICKPVGQSQGRGIFLFKSLSDLCYDSNAVVQRYIQNPLLIGGYKFDLRLYVCVPSYHPLTIYLYKEGLVRFSTDKFSLTDLNNPFCHLTNSSLNKLGPGYAEQKDRIGAGCKWNLKQLRHYFQQAGIKDWLLWQKISALVTLTVLSQSTSIPQTINCFEFYGFDVLVDDKLKPWLLEVNLSPALGNDCDVDPAVKKPLLHDLFDLLGLPVCNTGLSLFTIYTHNLTKPQPCSLESSEGEDGYDTDSKHLYYTKSRNKLSSAQNTGGTYKKATTKSSSTSALIVATAATKWRRKRRTNYLFGPPTKNNPDQQRPNPEVLRKQVLMVQELSNKNKPVIKGHNEKNSQNMLETNNSKQTRSKDTVTKTKQKIKSVNVKKREREGVVRVKGSENVHSILQRTKVKSEPTLGKTCAWADGQTAYHKSQIFMETNRGENEDKRDGKLDAKVMQQRHHSHRGSEYINSSEKNRKIGTFENGNVKNVVLPFDKSHTSYRGFRGRTRHPPPMLWGNGRDWRTPVHHEGDWGRIYPLNHNYNLKDMPVFDEDHLGNKYTVGDKQIRLVVHHVTKFIKISKQLYSSGLYSTEEELNAELMKNMGLSGEVWLPSK